MSNTDWSNVAAPEKEPEPEKKNPLPGMILFTIFIVALVLGLGAFVNLTMFGNRVKARAIADCEATGSAGCVLEVQNNHDECLSDNMVWHTPPDLKVADFQTGPKADRLGILSVNYAGYRKCSGLDRPKTLSEREAAARGE